MTKKRYFKREWEEEYYIFDSQVISEKEFDEKVEYEDYQAFADSMAGDTVVNRLNELNDENEQSKMMIATLRNIVLENEDLEEENEQLKQQLKDYHNAFDCSQCKYQNYNWFDGGDEFEVCDKGNNESQMDNHSCSEWEEL